ncbi:MAG: hypothetical protein JSU73_13615 [candidate division WOR-3 bacterium]|nr:MAG: hypothetical protein JSU73_13615 [candidate division WOR-3 bacterium]
MLASELPGRASFTEVDLLCASPTYDSGIFYDYRLLACHTSLSELTDTYAANYDGSEPDTVTSTGILELSWVNNQWGRLPFDTPFEYNGLDNLLLEFRWNGDDGRAVYARGWYPPGGNRTLDGYSLTSPTGTLRPYSVCLRLYYDPVGISEPAVDGPLARVSFHPGLTCGRPVRVFGLPDDASASIYTPSGRMLERLEADIWHPGTASPGIYFLRLTLGDTARILRLVVAR